ncbi:hypothetical protein FNB79_16825 [Formosa sediminum]|uniref:FUSC family protein n=1 Tax=Formosa sediminum TaxID=2594004 RepID=A0A516GVL1_9FLAO|nr:hypothetical protein [Formosa sediminum]QDO95563.1 hypothetical protein FNB79_16825 [Formosa sediminum]
MRKVSVISALILSIVATIWATLPASLYANILALTALIIALIGLRLSKQKLQPKSTSQLALLLSCIALILSVYKSIFIPVQENEIIPNEHQEADDHFDDNEDYDEEADLDFEEAKEKSPQDIINSNPPLN